MYGKQTTIIAPTKHLKTPSLPFPCLHSFLVTYLRVTCYVCVQIALKNLISSPLCGNLKRRKAGYFFFFFFFFFPSLDRQIDIIMHACILYKEGGWFGCKPQTKRCKFFCKLVQIHFWLDLVKPNQPPFPIPPFVQNRGLVQFRVCGRQEGERGKGGGSALWTGFLEPSQGKD